VIDHIVDFRFIERVVLEAHDSVADHDALDVDVLQRSLSVVVEDEVGKIRHVFSRIAFS